MSFDFIREFFETRCYATFNTIPLSKFSENADAQQALAKQVFKETGGVTAVSVPLQYENVPDTDILKKAKADKRPYARLVIRDATGVTISTGLTKNNSDGGKPLQNFVGLAIISLFIEENQGTKVLRDLFTILSTALSPNDYAVSDNCSTLRIRTAEFTIVGADVGWFQANTSIPYSFIQQAL